MCENLRARGRVQAYSAYSFASPARNACEPYCDVICVPSVFTKFFDIISNGAIFGKKLMNIKCVFLFSLQLLSKKISHSKKNLAKYRQKCRNVFM